MTWQVILVLMLLGHLVADYTLQGWLADGKQKSWWEETIIKKYGHLVDMAKYKYDYIAALVCHALYWSIFICAPFYASSWFIVAVILNTIVHAIVDDLKANRHKINLIQDQLLHLVQILLTFGIMMAI
jgi:hypothetical protein